MPSKARAIAKTAIRRVTRGVGYDIVPLAAGFTAVQRRVLQGCPAVADVGANVGQYAERLHDIGYGGRIISFEPGNAAYKILAEKSARRAKWESRNVALGAESGTAVLQVAANSVSSSLLDVGEKHLRAAPGSSTVTHEAVQVSTLDEELGDVTQSPLYLKLDVQGFELPVLTGGEQTLARTHAVQVEVSFDALYEGQTDWLTLCRLLQDHGFVVRYVDPGYEDRSTGFMLQADLLFVRP